MNDQESQEIQDAKKKFTVSQKVLFIIVLIFLAVINIKFKPPKEAPKEKDKKERDIIRYERYHPNENSYVYIVDKDYICYIDIDTKHIDFIIVSKVCYKNGKIYMKGCFTKKFTKVDDNEFQSGDDIIISDNPETDIDYIDKDNNTYTYDRIGYICDDITDRNIYKYLHAKNSIGDLINVNAIYKSTTVSNKQLYNRFEANDGTIFYVAASQSDPDLIKNNYVRIIGSLYEINDDNIPVLHSLSIVVLK